MSGNPILIKSYPAAAETGGNLFVKATGTDNQVRAAAAATDAIVGVSERMGAPVGGQLDVVHSGTYDLKAGDDITAGQRLTSDAQGCAVPAAALVGAAVRVGAIALLDAAADDLFPALIVQEAIDTPAEHLATRADDLSGTDTHRLVAPVAGLITSAWAVLAGALTVGDATLTLSINGTPVTTGVITCVQADSAAGDVFTTVPTAAHAVEVGDVIEVTVGGTNTAAVAADVLIQIAN